MANCHQNKCQQNHGEKSNYLATEGVSIYNPAVPFVHGTGDLYPNKKIIISGIPNTKKPSRMNFSLESSDCIAFVFDARFNYCNDKRVIVRNSKRDEIWEREERDVSIFPFQPGMFFEILVSVESTCFKVAVNNQHLVEFQHRIQPLDRIDTLRVDGDLTLTQVRFKD